MTDHATITVRLEDLEDLEPVFAGLRAGVELAEQARKLLELAPDPLVNPVLLDRRHLAPLQAAVDAFDAELEPLAQTAEQEDPDR